MILNNWWTAGGVALHGAEEAKDEDEKRASREEPRREEVKTKLAVTQDSRLRGKKQKAQPHTVSGQKYQDCGVWLKKKENKKMRN